MQFAEGAEEVVDLLRLERFAACGEPIVLDDPKDPDSGIHAPDANDRADHTAWIDIEPTSP